MAIHGWRHPFRQESWAALGVRYEALAAGDERYRPLGLIVRSVIEGEATGVLAGCTSHDDLMVVPVPIEDPPYGFVRVRLLESRRGPLARERIVIEHLSVTGHDEKLERPAADAVPLFWRFMIEKFGVVAVRQPIR